VTILRKKLTFCHLPDDWIRTNLQQVQQRIGRDALGAAIHRAGDDAQDALPFTYRFKRIGLEAGPLLQWLYSFLAEAGLPVICVETRHMRAVLKAQINKTDRNDARGIAGMFTKDCKFDAESLATLKRSFVDLKLLATPPDMSALYTEAFLPK
jgi:transposase